MGYPTKVQLISREKGKQWYVNFPNALAEAMQFAITHRGSVEDKIEYAACFRRREAAQP